MALIGGDCLIRSLSVALRVSKEAGAMPFVIVQQSFCKTLDSVRSSIGMKFIAAEPDPYV